MARLASCSQGPGAIGYFEIAPLAGYNTNGVNYVLTFLAAAVNPQTSTEVFSSFGPTTPTSGCGGNGCTNLLEPVAEFPA